jgi:hypothetical protein
MITRRLLVSAAPAVALAPLLAACAGKTVDQSIATVVTDVSTIANGLQGTLTQLGALGVAGLTPAIVSTVGNYVADLQQVATQVSGATTTAAAQPLVQKVETYVNTIVSTLALIPLPPPISTALQAAAILLPVIEVAVGLLVPPTNGASPGMTPDQARLVLLGAAAAKK